MKTAVAVFGRMRSIAVYRNMEKVTRDADVRNDVHKTIAVELDGLAVAVMSCLRQNCTRR